MGNSEWMLIHFILIFVFIFGTGLYLVQWLYMKDRIEQAVRRERERVEKEIFEDSGVWESHPSNYINYGPPKGYKDPVRESEWQGLREWQDGDDEEITSDSDTAERDPYERIKKKR